MRVSSSVHVLYALYRCAYPGTQFMQSRFVSVAVAAAMSVAVVVVAVVAVTVAVSVAGTEKKAKGPLVRTEKNA